MIGVALISYCVKKNVEVVALVNKNSKNKERIPSNSLITVLEFVSLQELYENDYHILKDADVLYHFAWIGTDRKNRNSSSVQLDNIKLTMEIFNVVSKYEIKKFIGAGSQAEYGNLYDIARPEDKVLPETAYGVAKFAAGKLSRLWCESAEKNIVHIWVRIFSVYGKYDKEDTFVNDSIKKLLKGEMIFLNNKDVKWDFLYCEDAAKAFFEIGKVANESRVYCLGSGEIDTLANYLNRMKKELGSRSEIKMKVESKTNTVVADVTSLIEDTGFKPDFSFEEGIKKTASWICNQSEKSSVSITKE